MVILTTLTCADWEGAAPDPGPALEPGLAHQQAARGAAEGAHPGVARPLALHQDPGQRGQAAV